jgi:CheY-like chemotaxis protein/anti-sigma regulatory factor (Ser/Thr protein kinase)
MTATVAEPGSSVALAEESERVLLVDDREDNLRALAAVLEPLGHEILTATSGEEALRTLLVAEASAIVLDVQMPGMDGFETATLLKSREATRSIPIVFLTAVGVDVEHEIHGYDVGAFDYVCKPFEPRVLLAKVRAAVRWNGELRALRRANVTYLEAAEALASLGAEVDEAMARPGGGTGTPVATSRVLDLELEATVTAPAVARGAVRQVLVNQPSEWTDSVVLLVSELLANVIVHARSAARLRVDLGSGFVRVEVEDAGMSTPVPGLPNDVDEHGRGLFMVARVADRCGWNRVPGGKSVWFELSVR